MKLPSKLEEITPKWLSQVLGMEISPKDFHLTGNIQEGTGMLSNIVRVSCQSSGSSPIQIVVKLPPNNSMLEMLQASRMDEKEIRCYKEILPELIQECPDLEQNLCKFFYGEVEESDSPTETYRSVLILQDLKPAGYTTIDFMQNLPSRHLEASVELLAKFHYAAYALEERVGKPLTDVYPYTKRLTEASLLTYFVEMFKFTANFLEGQPVAGTAAAAIKNLIPLALPIYEKIVEPEKPHACLIHTDPWPNNFLYATKSGDPVKIIDWQLIGCNDPTFDLAVLLITGVTEEGLTRENFQALFQLYFQVFQKHSENSKIPLRKMRSFQELQDYFYTYAMGWALIWLVFSAEPLVVNSSRFARMLEFMETEFKISQFLIKLCSDE